MSLPCSVGTLRCPCICDHWPLREVECRLTGWMSMSNTRVVDEEECLEGQGREEEG